jgi:Fatty acid desaturase
VPALPFLAGVLVKLTGWAGFWWLRPFVVFGVVPVVDVVLGRDGANPPDKAIAWLEQDRWYRWCTYLYLPLQYAGLVFACSRWAGGLSGQGALGLALTVGCVAAVGINTAHELGHKKDDVEKWLGKIALAQSGYGHFAVEHNRGHHVRVATVEDPASARLGESLWQYLPRTILGGLSSAWQLSLSDPPVPTGAAGQSGPGSGKRLINRRDSLQWMPARRPPPLWPAPPLASAPRRARRSARRARRTTPSGRRHGQPIPGALLRSRPARGYPRR